MLAPVASGKTEIAVAAGEKLVPRLRIPVQRALKDSSIFPGVQLRKTLFNG